MVWGATAKDRQPPARVEGAHPAIISKGDSIDVAAASEHIAELRERKESLESAADEARAVLAERRQHLDSAYTIVTFAEEMSEFLATSELTETKAFVHSFVKEIQVKPGKAGII